MKHLKKFEVFCNDERHEILKKWFQMNNLDFENFHIDVSKANIYHIGCLMVELNNSGWDIYYLFLLDSGDFGSEGFYEIPFYVFLKIMNYLETLTEKEIEQIKIDQESEKYNI